VEVLKGTKTDEISQMWDAPVLAENICWIELPIHKGKADKPGSHCLAHSMEGQRIVLLMELGVRPGGAVNNRLVVAKEVAFLLGGNA